MKKTKEKLAKSAADARFIRIRHLMLDSGVRFSDLARLTKVTRGTITLVAKGLRVSHRVQRAIARACKIRMEDLWS